MTLKLLPVAAMLTGICIVACNGPAQEVRAIVLADDVSPPPIDTMIVNGDTIQADHIASWNAFEKYNGRYAVEVALLDREPLKSRLETLLGKSRKVFMERFKITPPIEVENKILFNEGYMPSGSGSDEAAIAIDMERDIIYIGFSVNKKRMLFSEKKDTDYPEKFLQWLNRNADAF
ncbi:hypothetical protein DF182_21725 [Chitinophaga flava]|uniref:Chalcone isomerase domain-containing protein n=2 Tax=Chitinophaga flava TaxID=2259036 RepID=A0A365XSN9_9BACT|nr:hypothetical protein DF182_21725 [Chitinophaga flava]